MKIEFTNDEALYLSELIDKCLFASIRNGIGSQGTTWVRTVLDAYEKLAKASGYSPKRRDDFDEFCDDKYLKRTRGRVDDGKICALYEAGWGIKKIQEEMLCSSKTIYEVLDRNGVPLRTRATYAHD